MPTTFRTGAIRSAIGAALLAAFILSSCATPVETIFTSLEGETDVEVNSSAAIDSCSPQAVVKFGDDFYLAAGSVYRRGPTLSSDAWKQLALPSEAPRCTELAVWNGVILAPLRDSDGSFKGLYASSDGSTFSQVPLTGLDGTSIEKIFVLNGVAFLSELKVDAIGTTYVLQSIDSSYAATTQASVTLDSSNPYATGYFRSAAYDSDDSSYWFVAGSKLFRGALGSLSEVSGESGMPTDMSLKAITWSPDLHRLIVTTGSGFFGSTLAGSTPGLVYARSSDSHGGAWESTAAFSLVSSTDGYANLTDVVVVPDASSAPVIVAGSESSLAYGNADARNNTAESAKGYATLVPASDGSIGSAVPLELSKTGMRIAAWENFETTLYPYTVTRFSYLANSDGSTILFALTAGKGLWSDTRKADGTWEGWLKE